MEKQKYRDVYEVPIYIEKLVKDLWKLKDKESIIEQQIRDYIRLVGYPEDVPYKLLKYIEDDVIEGQERMVFD